MCVHLFTTAGKAAVDAVHVFCVDIGSFLLGKLKEQK